MRDTELAQQVAGAVRGGRAARPRPEPDVLRDGQVGEEGGVLEDQADAAPFGCKAGDVGAGEADLPALLGAEPGDGLQQHGLPGAGWAEHDQHPVGRDGEADRAEGEGPGLGRSAR